jgi:SAM-dependent methyltransferase
MNERESLFHSPPQILDACCGGRMWWWDKAHPLATYMDISERPKGSVDHRPNWECRPDTIGDFRSMPFADESFQLVLFDPPHIVRPNPSGRIVATFGALSPETEQDDLRRGFAECWRVLVAGGTLVFKWGAGSIDRVKPHFPASPIVATRSPRGGQTRWFIFYKPLEADSVEAAA